MSAIAARALSLGNGKTACGARNKKPSGPTATVVGTILTNFVSLVARPWSGI